jgi:hypothetical protein
MSTSQTVGASGVYYVAHKLSMLGLNCAVTVGNAPAADILVSTADGLRSVALQIKTSRNAYRKVRYGREGYEWDVGKSVIGKQSPDFLYVFVDLAEKSDTKPREFVVPSKWVAEFVLPGWSRSMYFLPIIALEHLQNPYGRIQAALARTPEYLAWSQCWPEDILVRWGVKNDT